MKNILILSILFIVFLLSCSRSSKNNIELNEITVAKENPVVDMIQIEFWPSFETSSRLTFLVNERKIAFQRIGMRDKGGIEPLDGSDYIKTFSPASFCFTLDDNEFEKIDSILNEFTSVDYNDQFEDVYDGIWMSVSITYSNDSIFDFELFNSTTQNQDLLIRSLLNYCIDQNTDSLTLEYLKKI